jgi:hypothetical protein
MAITTTLATDYGNLHQNQQQCQQDLFVHHISVMYLQSANTRKNVNRSVSTSKEKVQFGLDNLASLGKQIPKESFWPLKLQVLCFC